MTESTDKPRSFVEALVGEQAARSRDKMNEIAVKLADNEARTKKIQSRVGMWLYLAFAAACLFGVVMGCLAMWNAVVG